MPKTHSILELHRTAARMVARMERVEVVCLAAAMVISAGSIMDRLVPSLPGWGTRWMAMPLSTAVGAIACGAGLTISIGLDWRGARLVRTALGLLTALVGLAGMVGPRMVAGFSGISHAAGEAARYGALGTLVSFALVCLGIVVLFAEAGKGLKGWAPDLALFGAVWVVLALMAGGALGALHVFGDSPAGQVAPAVTAVVLLLTIAAAGRRAEYGRFAIFMGRGLGSRIARGILPIVLVLPITRELMRARLIRSHVFPDHYASAVLAATGTMIAIALLLAISWQFRRLEWEIQNLSLRDELTGLYNLRGFHLLGEQALRMARRSGQPFSVLFVDVDNLKQINDRLGHAAGSQLLIEAAEFLKANFRETDVVGRVGGDEFVVAGQFSLDAIEQAEMRLDADSSDIDSEDAATLSLSMGHVSADFSKNEALQDLLEQADAAMYERKRLKKLQPA